MQSGQEFPRKVFVRRRRFHLSTRYRSRRLDDWFATGNWPGIPRWIGVFRGLDLRFCQAARSWLLAIKGLTARAATAGARRIFASRNSAAHSSVTRRFLAAIGTEAGAMRQRRTQKCRHKHRRKRSGATALVDQVVQAGKHGDISL
jgi:hypothetical protein